MRRSRPEARVESSKKGKFPMLLLEGDSSPLTFAGLSFDGRRVITAAPTTAQGQ